MFAHAEAHPGEPEIRTQEHHDNDDLDELAHPEAEPDVASLTLRT